MNQSNNINVKHIFITNDSDNRKRSVNYAVANIIQQYIKNKTTTLV